MNVSAPFIERPIMTTLLMIAILVAGVMAYVRLPISSMPNVTYPTINVTVSFPGATPDIMAQAVALQLEKQFMAIPGVTLVSSNNTLGSSSIVLQFSIDKDMTVAAQDVQSAIITAQPMLPPQLPYAPVYRKVNPSELPVIYFSLSSPTMPSNELYTYANNVIGQRISMLKGVSQVTVFGSPLAIRIKVDPAKLAAVDMTLAELATEINLANPNFATGQLDGAVEAPNVAVFGQVLTAEEWSPIIVAYRNGTPIRVQDLGIAVNDYWDDKIDVQYVDDDGVQFALLVAVQKEPSANTVEISDAIFNLLESLKTELPASVVVKPFFDRSESIRATIKDVNFTLLLALVLVVLVIFIYLGKIRDTLVPLIILPLSIIATFILMDYFQFTLDTLSLLGLTLAVGFIVDDVIVVVENIVRHQEAGESRLEAAFNGSKQIGFTIISMSLSLIAVFIPMLLMGGLLGRILREFAITLAAVTVISGLLSLFMAPMLCSRFLPERSEKSGSRVSRWSKKFNAKLREKYRKALLFVFDHQSAALLAGLGCVLGTAVLFYLLPSDFLPSEDDGFFIAYVLQQEAGSTQRIYEYERQVMQILQADPAVESAVAISAYSEYRRAQNLVRLKPLGQRPDIDTVINRIKEKLKEIPGIQVFMKNVPLIDLSVGQENTGQYQYSLQSIYGDRVYPSAEKLIAAMKNDPHFEEIDSDLEIHSPQINVSILRDKAATLGLTATDIENAFSYSYSDNYVTRISTPIDQYDIILELLDDMQMEARTFNQFWMRSAISQSLVPLPAVAEWKEVLGAASINHINQFPSATISYKLAPGISLQQGLKRIEELQNELVEPGVLANSIGAAQTFIESLASAKYLLLLAIFTIYIILGMLYESFIHPLTVLSTLPPAIFGGLLVIFLMGLPLSLYAYLGIILLIGIVQKNGIMMIDFAIENIRVKRMDAYDAILDASLERFRPIMMTTIATIFGALPILLGLGANAASRRPLGLVIVGGLILAQFVTLFITPILYLKLEKLSRKFSKSNS